MNKYGSIRCAGCGSEKLTMQASYDGLDECSAAGEGSGFGVEVSLNCEKCGRVYPVCRIRDFVDVSDIRSWGNNNE